MEASLNIKHVFKQQTKKQFKRSTGLNVAMGSVKWFSTVQLSVSAVYALQGCHSSTKFPSKRQISKIHRAAWGCKIGKKKYYYHVTWVIHQRPVRFHAYNVRATFIFPYSVRSEEGLQGLDLKLYTNDLIPDKKMLTFMLPASQKWSFRLNWKIPPNYSHCHQANNIFRMVTVTLHVPQNVTSFCHMEANPDLTANNTSSFRGRRISQEFKKRSDLAFLRWDVP